MAVAIMGITTGKGNPRLGASGAVEAHDILRELKHI